MGTTILVVGATGNTGRSLLSNLPTLLRSSQTLQSHHIIALTRSATSAASLALASLPNIQVFEQDWTTLTPAFLTSHSVTRVSLAPHIEPSAFADESSLIVAMLEANIGYYVRISTTGANISPTSKTMHTRSHWAIENLLAQPEFAALKWTSLQPSIFAGMALGPAIEWVKRVRETGKQEPFATVLDADAGVGVIDAAEVGVVAAHLLAQHDVGVHAGAKYALSGPEDITGREVVSLMERAIGEKIESVHFCSLSYFDRLADLGYSPARVDGIKHGVAALWDGTGAVESMPTDEALHGLVVPKVAPAEAFAALRNAVNTGMPRTIIDHKQPSALPASPSSPASCSAHSQLPQLLLHPHQPCPLLPSQQSPSSHH